MSEHEIQQACEKQKALWESLHDNPILGNKYDWWNVHKIPWSMYNRHIVEFNAGYEGKADSDITNKLTDEELFEAYDYHNRLDAEIWFN